MDWCAPSGAPSCTRVQHPLQTAIAVSRQATFSPVSFGEFSLLSRRVSAFLIPGSAPDDGRRVHPPVPRWRITVRLVSALSGICGSLLSRLFPANHRPLATCRCDKPLCHSLPRPLSADSAASQSTPCHPLLLL